MAGGLRPRQGRRGQRVLVNGAGGGIGGFAVQLAKHVGAEVTATATPRSTDQVRRQGADRIIDYTVTPVSTAVHHPVDTIINLVPLNPPQAGELIPLVRPGGTIVSITIPIEPPPDAQITATHFITRRDTAQLAALATLVDTGAVTVEVSRSYSLTELHHVHRHSEAGDLHGKVTILP